MAAGDVERLRAARAARAAAAARAPPPARAAAALAVAWQQYLITFAAYCFSWWERLIVHATLAGAGALLLYGGALAARGARAAAAALAGVTR